MVNTTLGPISCIRKLEVTLLMSSGKQSICSYQFCFPVTRVKVQAVDPSSTGKLHVFCMWMLRLEDVQKWCPCLSYFIASHFGERGPNIGLSCELPQGVHCWTEGLRKQREVKCFSIWSSLFKWILGYYSVICFSCLTSNYFMQKLLYLIFILQMHHFPEK